MKFLITRTSDYDDSNKPVDGAFRGTYLREDRRIVNDPAKLPHGPDREQWYTRGKNHRVEGGHIVRNFDDEGWFITITSLEALIAFIKEHGSIVLGPTWRTGEIMEIEIYDGYRE